MSSRRGETGTGPPAGVEPRFRAVTGFGDDLERCTALVVVCFRADGCLLLLQAATPSAPWELPYGPAPRAGGDPAERAIPLVEQVSGVRLAAPPLLFGY